MRARLRRVLRKATTHAFGNARRQFHPQTASYLSCTATTALESPMPSSAAVAAQLTKRRRAFKVTAAALPTGILFLRIERDHALISVSWRGPQLRERSTHPLASRERREYRSQRTLPLTPPSRMGWSGIRIRLSIEGRQGDAPTRM